MRHDKRHILITRLLTGQQIEYARVLGLEPVVAPALEFEFPTYWDDVLKTINDHSKADWAFTSRNAVKALEQLMDAGLQVRPEIQLFAVGNKTRDALQELGLDAAVPHNQDSEHLAELIAEEGKIHSVIYFQGNLSRDELVATLAEKNIEVVKLEVYKTIIKPVHMPSSPVDAILFYSPSAVEGFKQGQGFAEDLPPLFAIGPTTAEALDAEAPKGIKIEVADQPDTEILLRTVADYLFNQEQIESN